MHYFQLISAIPSDLKRRAAQTFIPAADFSSTFASVPLSKTSFDLAEARCKNYYQMFSNYSSVVPSGIPWNIGLISFKTYIALLSITNPVKFALVFCIEQLNSNYNDKCICYIAGLSLNKISAAIAWFLVTCPWSNSNVFRPRYNCAVVARARSLYLFVFATWLLNERSKYITKHLTYGP